MKVGYFIRRCKDDVVINILSNWKSLRCDVAGIMNANMEASYTPLEGFSDDIWVKEVKDFRFVDNCLDLIV